ncbi:MAG: FHA domain-containing protein [Tannerellaceae bacterium]|jgi:pSer/pThr/pTyr-binding forkhead associated (FHA) protein|nr:FHA domain-containing protein [Tannerellaceae bacterium]
MEQRQTEAYRRSFGDSVGAGIGALTGSGKRYYILEYRTSSKYHQAGESQKIILNQVELGRDLQCQIRFDDSFSTVSRRHAAIVRDGDRWRLIHLSKVNQTFVNGQEVKDQWYLENGDEIQLSSNGPRLGFILPQGDRSMIKNINFTERFSLFRQQVMRPYQRMMWLFFVALVLIIGGLVGWNYYSDKQSRERILALSTQLDESNKAQQSTIEELIQDNARLSGKIDESAATQTVSSRTTQDRLVQLQNEVSATNAAMQRGAERSKDEIEKAIAANEARQRLIDSLRNENLKLREKPAIDVTGPAGTEPPRPTSYSAYYPYIYYIQLEKVEYIDQAGNARYYEHTQKTSWAGTGFLLSDGRFVTSRKVIERWYYRFGDKEIDNWLLTLHRLVEDKLSVRAHFSARSANGGSLTFTNEQFIIDRTDDKYDSKQKLYLAPASTYKDLAYTNISLGGGLNANAAQARSLNAGVELTVLGFPGAVGVNYAAGPTLGMATASNNGLDRGLISVTSSSSLLRGAGAPVFLPNRSGELEVVGVLSALPGIIVPLSVIY